MFPAHRPRICEVPATPCRLTVRQSVRWDFATVVEQYEHISFRPYPCATFGRPSSKKCRMASSWLLKGSEYSNCNCAWGCPYQFNAPSTDGSRRAVSGALIDEGHFGDVRLDGLRFVMILDWPGEIAEGNGKMQVIIDERADDAQFEAIRKISHGEDTSPGTTHYYVFNSTMTEVLETLRAPIDLSIDIEARKGNLTVPGLIECAEEVQAVFWR